MTLPRYQGEVDADITPLTQRCARLEALLDEERKRNARLHEDAAMAALAIAEVRAHVAFLEERLGEYARWRKG